MSELFLPDIKKLYRSQIDGEVDGLLSVQIKESVVGYTKDFLSNRHKFEGYNRDKIAELSKQIFPKFKERENHLQYCIDHFYEMIEIKLKELEDADTPENRLLAIDGVFGTFHHLGVSLDIILKHINDEVLKSFRVKIDTVYQIAEFLKYWSPPK